MSSDNTLSKVASFVFSLPTELFYLFVATAYVVQSVFPDLVAPVISNASFGILDEIPLGAGAFAFLVMWVNALGWYLNRTSGPVLDERQACPICESRGNLSIISSTIYCSKCHHETKSDSRKKKTGTKKSNH